MNSPEIAAMEFRTGRSGYEKDEVRAFLRRVEQAVKERDVRIAELEAVQAQLEEAIVLLRSACDRLGNIAGREPHPAPGVVPETALERGRVVAEECSGRRHVP